MEHLVIGQGEIGKALCKVFKCKGHDIIPFPPKHYDIIHIAIPYGKRFEKIVKDYQKRYTPKYTIIHSTVKIGTSKKLNALHSPVTGVHPHLAESLKTFTKFIGGKGSDKMTREFKKYGIPAKAVKNSDDTEAGKLYSLLIYGINVLLEKEIFDFCSNKLDYNIVYTDFVKMYNDGYAKMNMKWAKMYELKHKKGKIGGHCVVQNSPMLKTRFSKLLKTINNTLDMV